MDFNVELTSIPKGIFKGVHQATFSDKGLQLEKKGAEPILIPRGAPATFDGKASVGVNQGGTHLSIRILGVRIDCKGLAADVARYLSGDAPPPKVANYTVPGFLFALALLPLAIPILTLGGAIPAVIGVALTFACLSIAKNRETAVPVRTVMIVLIALVGVGGTFALFVALAAARST
jgi:hypothetical protein